MSSATDIPAKVETDPDEGPEPQLPAIKPAKSGGFFTVYKSGQGKWTRYGTAFGAILLVIVTAMFVHEQTAARLAGAFYTPEVVPVGATVEQIEKINTANAIASSQSAQTAQYVSLGLTAAVVAGLAILFWSIMNKPRNADFLIATDSEMKKVQWGTRAELIGSTRIVILFLAAIVLLLFLIDLLTGSLFYQIGLIKVRAF